MSEGPNQNSRRNKFWMKIFKRMKETNDTDNSLRSSSCTNLTNITKSHTRKTSLKAQSPGRYEFINNSNHRNDLTQITSSVNGNALIDTNQQFLKIIPQLFEIKESDRMDEDLQSVYLDKSSKSSAVKMIDLDAKKHVQKEFKKKDFFE